MKKIPAIRFGKAYESEEQKTIFDTQNQIMDHISVAIPLMFQTDIKKNRKTVSDTLRNTNISEIIEWVKGAGKIFATEVVSINGEPQTPDDYCNKVKQVTGLSKWMCHDILKDMQGYMENIEDILCKQFRMNTLEILENFYTDFHSMGYGIAPTTDIICAVIPGNHPVVNMMWVIAFAMKYPVIIKPSLDEPYTPLRLIYSLIQAGAGKEFFSYYPVEHSSLQQLVRASKCGILFGGSQLKEEYGNYPWVKVYGPGNSKILVDKEYSQRIDEVASFSADSVLYHSGRACISTSSIIAEENAEKIAQAIATKLSKIKVMDLNEDYACIAAFRDKSKAERIEQEIKKYLSTGKVVDMTPDVEMIQVHNNQVFLMPKVLYCKDITDTFFGTEYSFPFVMVGECNMVQAVDTLKETLSCVVLTDNTNLMKEILLTSKVEKVFQGFRKSNKMDYGMPHGGFLSEFLYHYKAYILKEG